MGRFVLYYHGSINPELLPFEAAEAASLFGERVVLRIVGYPTQSGDTLMRQILAKFGSAAQGGLIDYVGQISRDALLDLAATADIGLALITTRSTNINLAEVVGASNKAFDYMAAGLPLIVPDIPAWRSMYVDPGHALAANPVDSESIAAAISQLISHPERSRRMGQANQRKISQDWNYDTQFRPVIEMLDRQ